MLGLGGESPLAEEQLPYVTAYGNITKALDKIIEAQTPDRFTQDYLATTLGMTGGGARPVIPYLKRTGFLNPDGSPTDLYRRFRNQKERGAAAAEALRKGYARLYEANERVHALGGQALEGLMAQVTGLDSNADAFRRIVNSFKALKAYATFDNGDSPAPVDENDEGAPDTPKRPATGLPGGVNLGYTINLHLPPTSDVAVFNAIFKALREHLLT
jgi:hypothetical protein